MKKVFFIRLAYVLIDTFCAGLSIYLACWLRQTQIPIPVTVPNLFFDSSHSFHLIFIFWILLILLFNAIHGLYQTKREILESVEIWQVIRSVSIACVITIVGIYILKIEGFPRSILMLAGLFINITLSVWRVLKRIFVEFLVARGYNNFNVMIIGAGKVGMALAKEISKRPGFGQKIIGYLDDFKPVGEYYAGFPVLGSISDFVTIARREFINTIFISIHHDSKVFLSILEQAQLMHIAVRVVPQGFEFTTGEFCKYNIGLIPVLEYCEEEHHIKQVGKRLFDFVTASIVLLLLLPFFIILSMMIKLDSSGPVFYFSRRYGYRGKKFFMCKFRSMVQDADQKLSTLLEKNEVDGPIFKIRNDPRITPFGRFLRKYSLDELPQLINVLKGEMSLVGPRPLPIAQIEKEDLRQLKRLDVRPGITGLWQIRGRSDISFARLVKWDTWYINNWSFFLDLSILMQTIPVVFKGRGAY